MNDARRQVDMALEAGVNFIDTADAYGSGGSETFSATYYKDVATGDLASKARFPTGTAQTMPARRVTTWSGLRGQLATATDRPHRPLPATRVGWSNAAGGDAFGSRPPVRGGKVRYVGCSNFAGWQVMKALGAAGSDCRARFVSNQVYLSLLERSAEYDIVPTALDQGFGLLI